MQDLLIIKEQIRDLFSKSQDKKEAYLRSNELCSNPILKQNQRFNDIVKFLSTPYFEYMVTFLDHPQSGNSKNVIRVWRQMEKISMDSKQPKEG